MHEQEGEGYGTDVGEVVAGLKELVESVRLLIEDREEDRAVYSMETSDEQEMARWMKATPALLALKEIVDGNWQRDMIKYGGANKLTEKDFANGEDRPLTAAEAMQSYRDHVFEVLQDHGIVLDDLL